MQQVNIKRSELLSKVKANRAIHEKDYIEAVAVYRQAAIKTLNEMLKSAKTS